MSYSYEMDLPRQLVRVRLYGEVSDADLLAGDEELRADSRFQPEFDQIVDMSDAIEGGLTGEGIRELANRPPLFATTSRRALVVRSDLGYGLARMFQALRGDVAGEIQIFRSLAHAETWLGSGSEGWRR
jgi:hypothetical protein